MLNEASMSKIDYQSLNCLKIILIGTVAYGIIKIPCLLKLLLLANSWRGNPLGN
jgi:hypothetical protein